jgi:hypothetical protein
MLVLALPALQGTEDLMTPRQSRLVIALLALILATQVLPGLLFGVTFVGNCTRGSGSFVECVRVYVFRDFDVS